MDWGGLSYNMSTLSQRTSANCERITVHFFRSRFIQLCFYFLISSRKDSKGKTCLSKMTLRTFSSMVKVELWNLYEGLSSFMMFPIE